MGCETHYTYCRVMDKRLCASYGGTFEDGASLGPKGCYGKNKGLLDLLHDLPVSFFF
jgi:hypothetical protein